MVIIGIEAVVRDFVIAEVFIYIDGIGLYDLVIFVFVGGVILVLMGFLLFPVLVFGSFQGGVLFQFLFYALLKGKGRELYQLHQLDLLGG